MAGKGYSFDVACIGQLAARIAKHAPEGIVFAVFPSSFYIKAGAKLVCLGNIKVMPGPINAVVSAPSGLDWHNIGLRKNAHVRFSDIALKVDDRFNFSFSDATVWMPKWPTTPASPEKVRLGVALFRDAAANQYGIDGFGRFFDPRFEPGRRDYVCTAALEPLRQSRLWLTDAFAHAARPSPMCQSWVSKLVGLGPGLTPSGDDYLGGLMIALHALGEYDIAGQLWRSVCRCVDLGTNAISFAHLEAAADGNGSSAIHHTMTAILNADEFAIGSAIRDVSAIGHSSGWDAMTGVVSALEAWLAYHRIWESKNAANSARL